MADRQRFCITILSLMILGSCCYLGYFIFIDSDKALIDNFNWMRLCIFFVQHIITLGMLIKLLYHQQTDNVVIWVFQLSLVIVITFIGGQVFTAVRGGKIFGSSLFFYQQANNGQQNPVLQFQLNEVTLYYQIMTDFVMFFIVSAIALIVMKCKKMEEENKYEFMIDNLKSEEFVDEPNVHEKKSCAICLTDLANQRVLKVPCEHIFHKECLVNWLKRSTICPLCRTDIEQSLGPSSPLRFPGENFLQQLRFQAPPQAQQQPELTFPIIRPTTVSVGVQSNRANFTDRVHEQVSLGNSRVSISRAMKQRNLYTQRRNQNRRNDLSYEQPRNNVNTMDHISERPLNNNISNRNLLTTRSYRENSMRKLDLTVDDQNNRISSPVSAQSLTPRSVYLPSPAPSQNAIKLRFNQSTNPTSQPLVNINKETQQKKQHIFVPSQQQIPSPILKFYPNPNEKFVRNDTFRSTRETYRQNINGNLDRSNQMVRDYLVEQNF